MTNNDHSNDKMAGDTQPGMLSGGVDIRHLSAAEFGSLGVSQIAYVKPVVVNGAPAFAIHAADGTPMAMAVDREVALAAIVQNEMLPSMVH